MGERLCIVAARHPGRAVGVLAALAVLGTALSAGWTDRLSLSMIEAKAPILRINVHGDLRSDSPPFEIAVRTMHSQISADPAVGAVRLAPKRKKATSEVLLVRLQPGRGRDAAIARIESNLDPGPLRVDFRGPAAAVRAAKEQALDDLILLLAALPIVALVLALTIGVRGAGTALLAAVGAAALATLACELAAGAFEVGWLSVVGAVAAGTLVTLHLSTLGVAGARPPALLCAGLAAGATFGAAAALGVDYLASLALGGGLGATLAIPAAIVAAAVTAVEGRGGGAHGGAPWRGVGALVGFSRILAVVIAIFALALMVVAVAPVDRLAIAAIGAPVAPTIGAVELALAGAVALLVTIVLAATQSRRVWLSVFAAVVAAVPALATVGLLVVSFQEGGLERALDYTSSGAVALGSIATAVAVVAALGAAQAVALAWAGRETQECRPDEERVIEAVDRCAPAAAVACSAGIAAAVALGFGSAPFEKELGFGVAAGLALQLLLVQGLLAPALLRLTFRTAPDQ